jgi:hypothetical protein
LCEFSRFTGENEKTFCLDCDGPDNLSFDRDSLSPNNEDTTIATLGLLPCSDDVIWSIIGDDLGASITPLGPSSAEIKAGLRSGTIIVQAADALNPEKCLVRAPLEIGCGGCSEAGCEENAEIGVGVDGAYALHYECEGVAVSPVERGDPEIKRGMRAAFDLGPRANSESAGKIRILGAAPMTGFDTPLNLRYHVEPTEGEDDLVVYRTPNPPYALTAVRTPFILALVVYDYDHPDLAGYEIQYYTKDAVDNFETGGPLTWQFNADPYVVWDIDAATQDYHIKISKKVGGNVEIVYEYKYTTPSGNMLGKWELFVKDAQNTLIRKETQVLDHIGGTPPQIIRTHTVEQDGGLYSKVEDTLTAGHDWIDYALTKRVVDPSGAALTTEWTFELEAPPCQNCVSGRMGLRWGG